jgi:hypothetical protein
VANRPGHVPDTAGLTVPSGPYFQHCPHKLVGRQRGKLEPARRGWDKTTHLGDVFHKLLSHNLYNGLWDIRNAVGGNRAEYAGCSDK